MGAWGYGLIDSDGALDFLSLVDNKVSDTIRVTTEKYDKNPDSYAQELLGAAWLILKLGEGPSGNAYLLMDEKLVQKVRNQLEHLGMNRDWLGTWNDGGEAISKEIHGAIMRLNLLLTGPPSSTLFENLEKLERGEQA